MQSGAVIQKCRQIFMQGCDAVEPRSMNTPPLFSFVLFTKKTLLNLLILPLVSIFFLCYNIVQSLATAAVDVQISAGALLGADHFISFPAIDLLCYHDTALRQFVNSRKVLKHSENTYIFFEGYLVLLIQRNAIYHK